MIFKMKLQRLLELEQEKPLDKDNVMAMSQRKNLRYLYYDDLKNRDTLHKLLPEPDSGLLILFVKQNSEVGHFCLFFRNKRSGMHFFDPYGFGLKKVLDITGSSHKIETLMIGHDVHINKHPYQKLHKGRAAVNTCGRHCITRWNASHLKPDEYEDLMHHPSLDADEIVTMLTLEQDLVSLPVTSLK